MKTGLRESLHVEIFFLGSSSAATGVQSFAGDLTLTRKASL